MVQDFYIAENRTYTGYDKTLKTGPYNFGWANTRPDWVEKFPYQNGLLVWFSNGEFTNNNTSAHPGAGLILPVDARPKAIKFPGTPAAAPSCSATVVSPSTPPSARSAPTR